MGKTFRLKNKFSISLCVFLIAALFVVSSFLPLTFAQSTPVFSYPINLSNDIANATNPDVWNVGSNVYVAWTERSGGIMFRSSPDGGFTWNPPTSSPALILSPKGRTTAPLLSANSSNVYVVWSQTVGKTGAQIMEATSENYGVSFDPAVQITNGSVPGGHVTPVIASWGSDVYVAWASNLPGGAGPYSYVSCSTDAGATWTKPVKFGVDHEPQLAASGGQYVYAVSDGSIAVSSDNCATWTHHHTKGPSSSEPWVWASGSNVYVAWEGKGAKSRTALLVSNNYGANWKKLTHLTGIKDAWAPMVWASGNSAWIAVHTSPGTTKSQVYVYTTTNAGKTWSAPIALSSPPQKGSDTSFPFTIVSSDGLNVFVAWSQKISTGYWQMMVSYSSDGGSTWTAPPGINVSQNPNGTEAANNNDLATAAIASYGANAYVVWQYVNGPSNQIYFSAS